MSNQTIPQPTQPYPLDGYWSSQNAKKLLTWDFVSERMSTAPNYWIATINPDGSPHVVPVWGVWFDNTLYFGGSPDTRWARNLVAKPQVVVHLDDSAEAVMLEGTVTRLTDPQSDLIQRADDHYEIKYKMRHGPPMFQLHLRKVIAWKTMDTATRWLFDE